VLVKARFVEACDRHRERMSEINALHDRNASELAALMDAEKHLLAELQMD
jgi:hypothetical protein